MTTQTTPDVLVRPIRDVDAEAMGRVHAQVWHETYDNMVSKATLEAVSPRRLADLWSNYASRGEEYRHAAALVDGEIVGFAGSGPARDDNAPAERELYFVYLLDSWHRRGIGRQLFDAVVDEGEPLYGWIAKGYPGGPAFYEKRGFVFDGTERDETFLGEAITEVRFSR
ncbi:GNAT family N-acetyltransferase [Microbacterium amylolyticum]|uniref:GNAT superfamily N-acetyltransferase n=1 Tax=Microbacterium amylolyticum TaxID=936337 RepID=A0ABS4ZI16_9MICO|nr:GNAT family N-acetyltransferase [Microbacterium amylolyticum]MBP2436658.1 GNAT superfamily N-acetyltransferase [Microbacterium amylolyticum]